MDFLSSLNWTLIGLVVVAILSFKLNLIGLDFGDFKDFYKLLGRKGFAFLIAQVMFFTAYFYAQKAQVADAFDLFLNATNWNLGLYSGANVGEWLSRMGAARGGKFLEDPKKID